MPWEEKKKKNTRCHSQPKLLEIKPVELTRNLPCKMPQKLLSEAVSHKRHPLQNYSKTVLWELPTSAMHCKHQHERLHVAPESTL